MPFNNTIAAIATPQAVGGVSMIRISGENAIAVAKSVFRPAVKSKDIADMNGYTACYGYVFDGEEQIDDGILLVFKAPHSYTGEDVAEISCHGGIYVTRRVLQACLNNGAEMAEAGEFTKRALLNGKMSLTQAEAVIDTINTQSKQFLDCNQAQRDGALYKRIDFISEKILDISVEIAAFVDYPDETEDEFDTSPMESQLATCLEQLDTLLKSYDIGKLLRDGISTAIVGKPNVGKSTLMNLLTGTERSIVTDIAGTTRDIVEETVVLGDIVLNVADCAGIRETSDVVEGIGVKIMLDRLKTSSLILAVFDNSRPLSEEDKSLLTYLENKNVICIINKSDLEQKIDVAFLQQHFEKIITLSAKERNAVQLLNDAVSQTLSLHSMDMQAGFLANERQRRCAISAKNAIATALEGVQNGITLDATGLMLESALQSLYELSGKTVSERVIEEVFKRFCVGK